MYEIPFTKADRTGQYYLRMMNRKFKTGVKGHIADIKYNKKSTPLAKLHNIKLSQLICKILK